MPIIFKVLPTINGAPTYSVTANGAGMFVGDRFRCSPSNVVLQVTAVDGAGAPTAFKTISDFPNLTANYTSIPTQEQNTSSIMYRATPYLLDQTWTDKNGYANKTVTSYSQSIGTPGSWSSSTTASVNNGAVRIDANTKRAVSLFSMHDEELVFTGRSLRLFNEQGFVENYNVSLGTKSVSIVGANKDLSIVCLAAIDNSVTIVDYSGTATTTTTIQVSSSFTLGFAVWNQAQTSFALFERHTSTSSKDLKCFVFTKTNGVWGVSTYVIGTSYVFNPGGVTLRPGTNDKCMLSNTGTKILVVDSAYAGAPSSVVYARYGVIDLSNGNLLFETIGDYGFSNAKYDIDNIAISSDFSTVWQSTKSKHGWSTSSSSTPDVFPTLNNTPTTVNSVCSVGAWLEAPWFVAVGNGGTVYTSGDCTTWTQRTSGVTANLKDVAFVPRSGTSPYGGKFIVVGDNNTLLTSSDGITWTQKTVRCSGNAIAVLEASRRVIVVGGGTAKAIMSPDAGDTWEEMTVQTSSSTIFYDCAVGVDSKVMAVGSGGQIYYLGTNVTEWEALKSGTLIDLVSIAFSPNAIAPDGQWYGWGSFVVVGYNSVSNQRVILVSPDNNGKTNNSSVVWNQITTPTTGWSSVTFDKTNHRFVFSKTDGAIMYTSGNQIATSTLTVVSSTMVGVQKLKSITVKNLAIFVPNNFLVAMGSNGLFRTASSPRHFDSTLRKTTIDPTKLSFATDANGVRTTTETSTVKVDAFMPRVNGVLSNSFRQVNSSGMEFTAVSTGPYLYKTFTSELTDVGSESATTIDPRPSRYTFVLGPYASQAVNPYTLPTINFPAWTVYQLKTEASSLSGAYIGGMTVTVTTPRGVITCTHDSSKQYTSFLGTVTTVYPTPNEVPIYSGEEALVTVEVTAIS